MFRQLARAVPKSGAVRFASAAPRGLNMARAFATKSPTDFPTEAERSDYWSIGAMVPALKARAKAEKAVNYPEGYVNGDAALVVGKDGDDGSLAHIIRKYGTTPFVGLGLVTALSKELMVFNEEFMMFFVWAAFCSVAYVNLAEPAANYLDGLIEKESKLWDDAFEGMILAAEIHKEKQAWYGHLVPVLEQQQKDYKNMLEVSYKAKNIEVRNAAYNSMMEQLTRIANTEKMAREKAQADLLEKVFAGVWADFAVGKLDPKVKQTLLDNAIANLGTVTADLKEKDPVRMAFSKHIQAVNK